MAIALTKVNSFVEKLAEKAFNLGSDQLVVALTNTAHTSTWSQLSELTQVSYTNLSSRNITTTSSAQTGGTYKLVLQDLTLTASGAVGPFRYLYIYDDTATNDELIGYKVKTKGRERQKIVAQHGVDTQIVGSAHIAKVGNEHCGLGDFVRAKEHFGYNAFQNFYFLPSSASKQGPAVDVD
jgi:hypothetical protein